MRSTMIATSAGAAGGDEDATSCTVGDVAAFDFSRVDLAFFCGRAALSRALRARRRRAHAWVIDGSCGVSRARRCAAGDRRRQSRRRSMRVGGARPRSRLPGSASVALATALAPLHALAGLDARGGRDLSGGVGQRRAAPWMSSPARPSPCSSGKRAQAAVPSAGKSPSTSIPLVDALEADGASREERRLWEETRRVLRFARIWRSMPRRCACRCSSATASAVHAALRAPAERRPRPPRCCSAVTALSVIDPESTAEFPTPATLAMAPDQVYVGRLRADLTRDRALNFWIVGR